MKPHPADTNTVEEFRLSNLVVISHREFAAKDIQLNHVLHYTDALLTDYSGVFIDYMNLDRPIGFLLTDLKNYTDNRGFLCEKPLDCLPDMQLYTERDVKKFFEDLEKNVDDFKTERERLRYVYNDYSDSNNCRPLAEYLGLTIHTSN